jgi:hypothetical protein
MAIRPVDLQLAYMAAPQNAAVMNSAQEAPQAAQQAAASAFAAEVTRREEQIEQPDKAHGSKVGERKEREHPAGQRRRGAAAYGHPEPVEGPLSPGEALDGEQHIIDVMA